jgi:hypothetical protein
MSGEDKSFLYSIFTSVDTYIFMGIFLLAVYLFFKTKKVKKDISFASISGPIFGKRRKIRTNRGYQGGEGKNEARCRQIFQNIFKVPFTKVRPSFLTNPKTKRPLELDGFNPEIKTKIGMGLAFEYDGAMHSSYNPYFHKSPKDFVYQAQKDSFKDKMCREKGIYLIRIPHFIQYDKLEGYIREKVNSAL